ncbi:MAG: AAA family ATPase [Clostridia bacterium]|nr:AAA family ATPase [Clostridia bacterium]
MIITITGKPCTGKSTMAEIFVKKYNFDRMYAGAIFKKHARELGIDITELTKSEQIYEIDYRVDKELEEIYHTRLNDNLLIESRTSWSFMPKAFNVFINIPNSVMAERLFNSDRPVNERGNNLDEALQKVTERYNADVKRYKKLYNIDCDNLSNYSFVIDNSNLTPEQTADEIYKAYLKFINN